MPTLMWNMMDNHVRYYFNWSDVSPAHTGFVYLYQAWPIKLGQMSLLLLLIVLCHDEFDTLLKILSETINNVAQHRLVPF